MTDNVLAKKIKDKISKDEGKLQKLINDAERIWENTGLDPKDPSYLVEKTMRFEMAHENISRIFLLFHETIDDYKKLCAVLEKSDDS
jgi:hypothetical protein